MRNKRAGGEAMKKTNLTATVFEALTSAAKDGEKRGLWEVISNDTLDSKTGNPLDEKGVALHGTEKPYIIDCIVDKGNPKRARVEITVTPTKFYIATMDSATGYVFTGEKTRREKWVLKDVYSYDSAEKLAEDVAKITSAEKVTEKQETAKKPAPKVKTTKPAPKKTAVKKTA